MRVRVCVSISSCWRARVFDPSRGSVLRRNTEAMLRSRRMRKKMQLESCYDVSSVPVRGPYGTMQIAFGELRLLRANVYYSFRPNHTLGRLQFDLPITSISSNFTRVTRLQR